MILYALRLLVALLTFAVGITAAWLLDFKSASAGGETKTVAILVGDDVPPPPPPAPPAPPRSCAFERHTMVAGGVLNGKAVSKPQAVYPSAAKEAHVSGMVVVQIEVDEDGNVAEADAISGPEMLREAAEDAALEARFSPTRLSGQPVRVSGVVTYNFVLK